MTPQLHTLHLLATPSHEWTALFNQLRDMWTTGDALVLASEGVQGWQDERLAHFGVVYALDTDVHTAHLPRDLPAYLQLINHDQWADLILSHQRCLTWR